MSKLLDNFEPTEEISTYDLDRIEHDYLAIYSVEGLEYLIKHAGGG